MDDGKRMTKLRLSGMTGIKTFARPAIMLGIASFTSDNVDMNT